MNFAPEKCFIVAKEHLALKLGEDFLPQVEEAKSFWELCLIAKQTQIQVWKDIHWYFCLHSE